MHHPTDRIAHTTAFVTPVVEHWLKREIAQWVHRLKVLISYGLITQAYIYMYLSGCTHMYAYRWWSTGWDTTHIPYTCTSGGALVGTLFTLRTPVNSGGEPVGTLLTFRTPVNKCWSAGRDTYTCTSGGALVGTLLTFRTPVTVVEHWLGHYSHSIHLYWWWNTGWDTTHIPYTC